MKLYRNLKAKLFYKEKELCVFASNIYSCEIKIWSCLKKRYKVLHNKKYRGTIEFQISSEDWYESKDTYQDTYNNDLQLVVFTSNGIYKSEQFEIVQWSEEHYGSKDGLIIRGDFMAMMKKEENNSPYSAITEAMEIAEKSDLKMGKVEDNPKFNKMFESQLPSVKSPKAKDRKVLVDNRTGRETELEAVHFTIQNNDQENQIIKVETKESIDWLICSTTFSLSVISQYSSIEIDNVILEKHKLVDNLYYVIPKEKRLEDLEFSVEHWPDVHTGDMIVKIYKFDHSGKQTVKRAIKLRVDPEILFELPEGAEIPQRCISNKGE